MTAGKELEPCKLLMGIKNGPAVENSMVAPQKMEHRITI